ncbi:hypothetical protein CDL15_Pgr023252 [Punica granatum]|uniref:Gnk2-homologous domain-containing protein n=1 Tax=Punica granatum TaxID=22663 RepID=A0A218X5A5_PUNGR|nr:hypothetical protein CDL15_Pgr023252 [Punica granatum]PKI42381.1 hypothetical protein CRG98_037223 [Punica granatum]
MFFSKPIPLFLLSISLLCSCTVGTDDPLYHICFSPENFTSSSPYRNNLNDLLGILSTKVPPTGFGTGSSGSGQDVVYGLGLCRGDVKSDDCKTCVVDAGQELQARCPTSKGAIIWYDNCLLKYSDKNFFGKIDNKNKFHLLNVQDVDMDFMEFYQKIKDLLGVLAEKASGTPILYASGDEKLNKTSRQTLFGLAQCTRDLTAADCKTCLDHAISDLPSCCYGKRGGRTVGASCNVRYELYPFVNV